MYTTLADLCVPPPGGRWRSVGTSVAVHVGLLAAALTLGGPVWKAATSVRPVVRLTLPPPPAPLKALVPPPRRLARTDIAAEPLPDLAPVPVTPAPFRRLEVPRTVAARRSLEIEAPPEMAVVSAPLLPLAAMPVLAVKPLVRTGLLDSAAATGDPGAKRVTAQHIGFDASESGGSARRGRGTAAAGFGDPGTVTAAAARERRLATGGFEQTEAPAARVAAKAAPAPFAGIEILEKPHPVYTEEARRLRIEGTVQLRVVFSAGGQIKVLSVVKGLGHGLDEAAVRAAEAIRFRPAQRDGRAVDAPAVIQIQFQLA